LAESVSGQPGDSSRRPPGAGWVRAEAVVDTAALAANTAALLQAVRRQNADGRLMAVVKADGYGHGAVPSARAALAGGASHLGVATPGEALQLRAAGIDAPILAWLWPAGEDIRAAVHAGVELGVSSLQHLDAVLAVGGAPRIHVKVDTGLGRNGAGINDVGAVLDAVGAAHRAGRVRVTGLMSHLACADLRGDASVGEQTAAFRAAVEQAEAVGITGAVRHLANTPAVLDHPATYFDMVRCGIGIYGVDPLDGDRTTIGLRPAMTLRGTVALTKRVPAGHGVSYGLTYRTSAETTLALVPLGYADGIPRAASSVAEVWLRGKRRRVAGRVAMDQFVVDCGDDEVAAGDEVVVFGPGDAGEPTANEWAAACGTIGYEIVTRIGPRVPRRYVNGSKGGPS
jgi:alanine racemase